jgi:hypothetical protein
MEPRITLLILGIDDFGGFSIGHHARTREEVDALLARAGQAGATIPSPARETHWRGYIDAFRSGWSRPGDRLESARLGRIVAIMPIPIQPAHHSPTVTPSLPRRPRAKRSAAHAAASTMAPITSVAPSSSPHLRCGALRAGTLRSAQSDDHCMIVQ